MPPETTAPIEVVPALKTSPSPGLLFPKLGFVSTNVMDFSRGTRLEELNILLKHTVMIRRLKEHVMAHLPPKRRQIIRLLLKKSDIASAKDVVRVANGEESNASDDLSLENADQSAGNEVHEKLGDLSYQELGIAKLSGFLEWLSLHPVLAASDEELDSDISLNSHKMIIFAHHHKVLNKLQEYICEKGVTFVRIDGNTLPRDRQSAVISFQTSFEVWIAIIGITAGGVGLNLSAAKSVSLLGVAAFFIMDASVGLKQYPTLMTSHRST